MIKARVVFVMIGLLIIGSAWITAVPEKNEDVSKQLEDLKKKVASLEKTVKSLEKRLDSVAKKTITIPKMFPEIKQLPKGWQKRVFNGTTYYVIPLDESSKKSKNLKK